MSELTAGRILAKNTGWNLLGAGAPLLVAVFAIPLLLVGMGTPRFGLLTLAWVVIGYFGLFDLGLGRALTKLVSDRLGEGREEEIPELVWTALALMLVLGVVGGLVVGLLTPLLVQRTLRIPFELQGEASGAFYLLAASIPVVISTTGLRGVLEAHQRFALVNAVRLPLGVFMFLGPLLVLPFSASLVPIVAVLVVGRVIGWVIHLVLCIRVIPGLRESVTLRRAKVRPLLAFGSWMTVTNIVSPLLVYLDRFLIGAVLSVTAVAYYATPYEVVIRLLIVPSALAGVLFPAFAASLAQDRNRTAQLFGRGTTALALTMFLPLLLIVMLAHEGLTVWLGAEFAQNSTTVLQWLAVGVFANGLARVPFALVQGMGRPDVTAKLHLVELVVYLPALWVLLGMYGIKGAAIAWTARVSIDMVLLFTMAGWFLPPARPYLRRMGWLIAGALVVLTVGTFVSGSLGKGLFMGLAVLGYCAAAWVIVLRSRVGGGFRGWLAAIR